MTKIKTKPVTKQMAEMGSLVKTGVQKRLQSLDMLDILDISGHPAWTFLKFADVAPFTSWQVKTLFLQEFFARGFLSIGTHNMSYAHSREDVEKLLGAYDEIFPLLKDAVRKKNLLSRLRCEALEPLFKVR